MMIMLSCIYRRISASILLMNFLCVCSGNAASFHFVELTDTTKLPDVEIDYATYLINNDRLEYFKAFEGKFIRNIRVVARLADFSTDASGRRIINWGSKVAMNLANALHVDSRPDRIRDYLLIKKGEKVTALKMTEAERVLRANRFLEDAVFLIENETEHQVDVVVIVSDIFSLVPEFKYYNAHKFTFGQTESNVAGSTNFLGISAHYDPESIRKFRPGIRFTLRNPLGNYITFSGAYSSFDKSLTSDRRTENSLIFKAERPYLTNLFRWQGGVNLGIYANYDYFNDSLFTLKYKYKYSLVDGWIGFNNYKLNLFNLLSDRWSILYTARFTSRQFSQRPSQIEGDYRYNTVNQVNFLLQASLFRRGFKRYTYLFDLGRPEDIETGRIVSLTGAWVRRNNQMDYYLGGDFQLSEKPGEERFISLKIAMGGYIHKGYLSDGKWLMYLLYLPGKRAYADFYFRNNFSLSYSHLFNPKFSYPLTLESRYGATGYGGEAIQGDIRLTFKYEGLFFLKNELWGFNLAPLFTSQWFLMYDKERSDARLYALLGLGGRIRNKRLISSAFEAKALYYPRLTGRKGMIGFELATTFDLQSSISLVHRPEFLEL